jgi:predicted  nucleic acid-binding Zn-ribbon protein
MERICACCGEVFTPSSVDQDLCPDCLDDYDQFIDEDIDWDQWFDDDEDGTW